MLLLVALTVMTSMPAGAQVITVGIDNNQPLTFINSAGQADGLFPELLGRIAGETGWTLNYVPCQWQQCLEKLASGRIDILPAIAYTPERAERFRFARETVVHSWGQVYHRKNRRFESILQLDNSRIAVLADDVYFRGAQGLQEVAERFGVNLAFRPVASYQEAFELVAAGRADAAMVGRLYGQRHHRNYQLQASSIMIKPIEVRPAFAATTPPAFVATFDRFLADWKNTPGSFYYQALESWLGDQHSSSARPAWLGSLMYALSALLVLLAGVACWTRRQIKIKTRQLEEQNRLLARELQDKERIGLELRERQQQYRVLFEESHVAMVFVEPGTGDIVDANPAACRFYRYTREQLQGIKVWRLDSGGEARVRKQLTATLQHRQRSFESVHCLADGEKRTVEVHNSPIRMQGRSLICAIILDISQRKQAEQDLEERNQFLQSLIDGVSDPLLVIGLDYRVLQMNQAARELRAHPDAPDAGSGTCHELSHARPVPCAGEEHPCPLREVMENEQTVTVIHQHETPRGRRIIEVTASPLYDAAGTFYAIIEVSRDITERLQIEELLNENEKRLHHLAHHDHLTDLPNRLLFADRLQQAISKARRSHRQIALFFLDLDEFKTINDTLGHDHGDLLLIDVARRLQRAIRESDTVARMGGDEFLILLEDIESVEMIESMAERISRALTHTLRKDDFVQEISASIGISIFPEDATDGQELLKKADLAMYQAKSAGRSRYHFYNPPQGRFLFA